MTWIRRLLGTQRPAPPADRPAAGDELLRAGFDRESRGDFASAERHYQSVPDGDPAQAQALFYLGRLAMTDRRQDEAISLFQRAADDRPDEALYWLALADALFMTRQYADAISAYEKCRALQSELTVMSTNYAAALIEVNRREEARHELERLRDITPLTPELHFNLGGIYREYCRTDEAIAAYRRALELKPEYAPTFSNLLLELNMDASLSAEAIFAEHRRFGERFARRYRLPDPDRTWPRGLRIGYVSPDFRTHVVSFFLEPILTNHDHERFEVFCYHVHAQKDQTTEALRRLADHWLDCEDLSDAQLAERIRADRIDILVDLAGHTADNRMMVFAEKPAPVQATYLGYPNTTGLTTVDYRISDPVADPPGQSEHVNTERLIRLPDSHFCFRPGRDSPAIEPLPAAAAGYVTFGCFNHFAKISLPFLDTVARVLKAVPRSRFLLKGRPLSAAAVRARVQKHFEDAGIEPGRVELRGWEATTRSHLTIYNSVDIALDSFPYSGATTTCEALWMGVPVVSYAGKRHVGRMCASILTAVGLGAWVSRDTDEYVAKCVDLSGDLKRLAELRQGMRERLRGSPLLDEVRFTRNLERCYVEMWERSVLAAQAPQRAETDSPESRLETARALRGSGKATDAVEICRGILLESADHPGALELLWDTGFETENPGIAAEPLLKAIRMRPGDARLHYMYGCVLQALGRFEDAIGEFRLAIEIEPRMAKAHNNLGVVLEAKGDLDDAATAYASAIGIDAALAQAHFNLGALRYRRDDLKGAIAAITRALALEPGNATWHCRLGEMLFEDRQADAALESFRAAAKLDPTDERVRSGLARTLLFSGRPEEAIDALRKALEGDPSNAWIESRLLHALHYRSGDDAQGLFDSHKAWAHRHARGVVRFATRALRPRPPARRINVGYLSAGFGDLPVTSFVEPVLVAHNRAEFNVFCYALSSGGGEAAERRWRELGCTWRDISGRQDLQAIDRIQADSIDILVDLTGHALGGRPLLLAHRPAPIQVSWLGYPSTTGLSAVDFRITDAVADPVGASENCYAEKLVRLPNGFLCYLPPSDAPGMSEPPDLGADHFTFGCFSDVAKITPDMVALWCRLLKELPRSRMVFQANGFGAESARDRLLKLFAANDVATDRVHVQRPELSHARHLAKYHDVDVALDVFPYNSRATTCEALWMGVPVVTLAGRAHASRTGASILRSAGLARCVAETADQYVELATVLARDTEGRRALRHTMRERLRSSALLDAQAFARSLEAAYRGMWSGKERPVASAQSAGEPLRLHVGAKEPAPGWKILDARPGPHVDFVGDCSRDLGQFEDGSVAEIYISHVVEHLGYQRDLPETLAEFHRILRSGGKARISVPDFETLCRLFLEPARSKDERLLLMRMVFGGQLHEFDFHYVGLTYEFLHDFLSKAGFSRIEKVDEFGLFEDSSMQRFGDTLISLNVIAYK